MAVMNHIPLFSITGLGPMGLSLSSSSYGIASDVDCSVLMQSPGDGLRDHYAGGAATPGSLTRLVGPRREGLSAMAAGPKGGGKVGEGQPTGGEQYALMFISGKYPGGKYPLTPGRDIVIGRKSDQDVVLIDSAVSLRHAKISIIGGRVFLEDLGSHSGTFVNGQRIQKAVLKDKDFILIGSTIIRLSAVAPVAAVPAEKETPKGPASPISGQGTSSPPERLMYGSLEAVPLPDLLQLLSASANSGIVTVRSEQGVGKIYLRQGRIYFCEIEGSPNLEPHKAFYRLLWWSQGRFELDPVGEHSVANEITESVGSLLMEGMYQQDEIRRLGEEGPPFDSKLAAQLSIKALPSDLTPAELDLFQLVIDHGTVASVLDHYPGSDLEAYTHLISLIKRGFAAVS